MWYASKTFLRVALAIAALFVAPEARSAPAPVQDRETVVAFVVLGEDGVQVARAITYSGVCPQLTVDGSVLEMSLRAGPSTEPQRPTASVPELSKPSAFPVRVCEAPVPRGVKRASIEGRDLPLAHRALRRLVVIGDTGCRLKAKDDAWQACNDPVAYPFARIAARAAAWKPDAVVHVGDYLYRENPCPESRPGCSGSPWGYGWDAWNADFFAPAGKLLEAAPWILVRGNHESCSRGGQGWWRLMDPRPLQAGRDCRVAADDVTGDTSPAYSVPLGDGAQVVVMDLSHAGTSRLAAGDPHIVAYQDTWRALSKFAGKARFTFAADHYPIFGVAAKEGRDSIGFIAGNPAIQQVFGGIDPAILPEGVDALLAGHIHLWEQVDLGGRQPSQFVAGFSGTQEDVVRLPQTLPPSVTPAPNAPVRRFDSLTDVFGFMTLERTGATRWVANVYAVDGEHLRRCTLDKRRSQCASIADAQRGR